MSQAFAYERIRAATLRGTWIFPVAGVVLAWLIAGLTLAFAKSVEFTFPDAVTGSLTLLSLVLLTVPCAQAFGHEYRDGTMRLSLTLFPVRGRLLTAKFGVPTLLVATFGALFVLGIAVIALFAPTSVADLPVYLVRVVAFAALYGLLVAGVTALTRVTAAGVTGLLVWALVVENLVQALVVPRASFVEHLLPVAGGRDWLDTGSLTGLLTIAVAAAVVVALAAVAFMRRDA